FVEFELPDIEGDVDAEGRLVVTEESSQTRSHVEWGLESKTYDPSVVPPYLIDSDVLVTSGFLGAQGTGLLSNTVTAAPLSTTTPVTICSTGNQYHVGAFKVKARVIGDTDVKCRFAWRIGEGALTRN